MVKPGQPSLDRLRRPASVKELLRSRGIILRTLSPRRISSRWRALMIVSGSVIPRQDIDAARESQMTALANINP